MSPQFSKYLSKMSDLIDQGKLPLSVIPRLFYYGHEMLHGIISDIRKYKCIDCNMEWEGEAICPSCGVDESGRLVGDYEDKIWDITGDSQLARWRCYNCSHEWTSEDGKTCPECQTVCNPCGPNPITKEDILAAKQKG